MNHAGPVSGDRIATVAVEPGAAQVAVPHAGAMFRGAYQRAGPDLLVVGEDGRGFHVPDYFAAETRPDLVAPGGSVLAGSVVEALSGHGHWQMAQAAGASAPRQIGRVETLTGSATVQRGAAAQPLAIGDAIFQGDVIASARDAKLGLKLADDTVFSLSGGARMVMNELVYDPARTDNTFSANLVEGTFVFITGQVAKTGSMRVTTPVATMGIRGTTPYVVINAVTGQVEFKILPDPDGRVGAYQIVSLTNQLLAVVQETTLGYRLDTPSSPPVEIRLSDLQLQQGQQDAQEAYRLYNQALSTPPGDQPGTTPQGPGPNQNTPGKQGFIDKGQLIQIAAAVEAVQAGATGATATGSVTLPTSSLPTVGGGTGLTVIDTTKIETVQVIVAPQTAAASAIFPAGSPPIRFASGSAAVTEDTPSTLSGFTFSGVPGDTPLVVRITARSTITLATTQGLVVIGNGTDDVTMSGSASALLAALNGLTYQPSPDAQLGGLTIKVTAADGSGGTLEIPVAITPVPDPPVARADAATLWDDGEASGNALANDSDPDPGDTIRLLRVGGGPQPREGEVTISDTAVTIVGDHGTLRINPDGSYLYVLDPARTGPEATTDVFHTTIVDSTGREATAALTVTIPAGDAVTLEAQKGGVRLTGGRGNDKLTGHAFGSVTLEGRAGDDTLEGPGPYNSLAGGRGNDRLSSETLSTLDGGEGDDTLIGGQSVWASFANATAGVTVDLGNGEAIGQGNDQLYGISRLIGSAYADSFVGGDGPATFQGGAGDDTLDGGVGLAMADYSNSPSSVRVDLGEGTASGGEGNDRLLRINQVLGSRYDDTLIGSGSDETLFGGEGNDSLDGRAGADFLDGGLGQDTASFAGEQQAIQADLGDGAGQHVLVGSTIKTLMSIEAVIGTAYDDSIVGRSDVGSTLMGGAGADTLRGNGFADYLQGGSPSDDPGGNVLDGGDGADTLVGLGGDTLTGGLGNDVFVLQSASIGQIETITDLSSADTVDVSQWLAGRGVTAANLGDYVRVLLSNGSIVIQVDQDGTGSNFAYQTIATGGADQAPGQAVRIRWNFDGDVASLTLPEDSGRDLTGTAQADTLTGGAGADKLRGLEGDDSLAGRAGNDTLDGGSGNDTLDGGAGNDIAVLSESWRSSGWSIVSGADGESLLKITGPDGVDLLQRVETLRFSDRDVRVFNGTTADEALTGTDAGDLMHGGRGNDTLTGLDGDDSMLGGGGNDSLLGGAGDDELWGNEGANTLDGGDGEDTAHYHSLGTAVTVNLATGTAFGNGVSDRLSNIEDVSGSAFADSIQGDHGGNWLYGGLGNDTLDGGGGNDWADLWNDVGAVRADLAAGTASGGAGNDRLSNIEGLRGSRYDDVLIGDSADNTLRGDAGDDTLDGGFGNDWAFYHHATSAVRVDLYDGSASGGDGNDILISIEAVRGSAFADTLIGDDGDNTFRGMAGADSIDGGIGFDAVDYRDVLALGDGASGVRVDLVAGAATVADGNDRLTSIENVVGSVFDDTLTGNTDANDLSGGVGNDSIAGGGGNDTLRGGTGRDTFSLEALGADPVTIADFETGAAGDVLDLSRAMANVPGAVSDVARIIQNGFGQTILQVLGPADGLWKDVAYFEGNFAAGDSFAFVGRGSGFIAVTAPTTVQFGASITGTDNDDTIGNSFTVNGASDGVTTTDIFGNTYLLQGMSVSGPTSFADTISGGLGSDSIDGGAGDDSIIGGPDGLNGADDDLIYGGDGADKLLGGAGNDTLQGGTGADTVLGGAGDDVVGASNPVINSTEGGADRLEGGDGNDTLYGDFGGDTLLGGADDDFVSVELRDPFLAEGGSGNDTLTLYSYALGGPLVADLGAGALLSGGVAQGTFNGFESFLVNGTSFADSIVGGGGDDTLDGVRGDDTLVGGQGDDALIVRLGNVSAAGGGGSDTLTIDLALVGDSIALDIGAGRGTVAGVGYVFATSGIEERAVLGGSGADSIVGGSLSDTITGGAGADTLLGGGGDDVLTAGTSLAPDPGDLLKGDAGNDTLLGGDGDTLAGGTGNDLLQGDAGSSSLDGGDGNDTLFGQDGADTVAGGAGQDIFLLQRGATDRITDFEKGAAGDLIDLSSTSLVGALNDVVRIRVQADGSALVQVDADGTRSGSGWETVAQLDGSFSGGDVFRVNVGVGATTIAAQAYVNVLTGTAGDDFLDGTSGADSIAGLGGNDTLTGRFGPDTLLGGDGSDLILIGFGAAVIVGGLGNDTLQADLSNQSGPMLIDIGNGGKIQAAGAVGGVTGIERLVVRNAQAAVTLGGAGDGDILDGSSSADSLSGAGGNDSLNGFNGANSLDGGAGDDSLYGGTDSDVLIGGDGNDVLWGGGSGNTLFGDGGGDSLYGDAGDDLVRISGGARDIDGGTGFDTLYVALDGSAVIDLTAGTILSSGISGTIAGIEKLITVGGASALTARGAAGDDVLNGGSAADSLSGEGGNDSLWGGAGADTLSGGEGADSLSGSGQSGTDDNAADSLSGGAGDDTLDGGGGADTLTGGLGQDRFRLGSTDRVTDFATTASGDILDLSATPLAGTLNDVVRVRVQSDGSALVQVDKDGAGSGSSWQDWARLDGSFAAGDVIRVDIGAGASTITAQASANVLAGTAGRDNLTGTAGADSINGLGENDTIRGLGGLDTLLGGDGNDSITMGFGAASIDGGLGTDDTLEADLSGQTGAVLIDLENGGRIEAGGAVGVVTGIERLRAFFAAAAVTLGGANGNDYLNGSNVADSLAGRSGDDSLIGNAGDDLLDGGLGNDYLFGGADADTLLGGADQDTLYGGAGADSISGNEGSDDLYAGTFDQNSGADDRLEGGVGSDRLFGDGGKDTLLGGDNNDSLSILWGAASIDGGAGNDTLTVSISTESRGLAVDIQTGRILAGSEVGAVTGIEVLNATGGSGADSFVGGAAGETLEGGLGNDTLIGGEGNDRLLSVAFSFAPLDNNADYLDGGLGRDTIDAQGGADTVLGGQGDDIISAGWGAMSIDGGQDNDSLTISLSGETRAYAINFATGVIVAGGVAGAFANVETVTFVGQGSSGAISVVGAAAPETFAGGSANDTLLGGGGNDSLVGNDRNDSLGGGDNSDTLEGGDGADTLDGGPGNDVLKGGAGNDVFVAGAFGEVDRVTDWQAADIIDLSNVASLGLSGLGGDSIDSGLLTPFVSVNVDNTTGEGGFWVTDTQNGISSEIFTFDNGTVRAGDVLNLVWRDNSGIHQSSVIAHAGSGP
jgi:Ca2+-binding RTX toxin-like protein